MFTRIDQNHNTYISAYELRALVLGIQIGEVGLDSDYVDKAMEDFDISGDSQISEQEFVDGISKWVNATPSANGQGQGHRRFLSSKTEVQIQLCLHYISVPIKTFTITCRSLIVTCRKLWEGSRSRSLRKRRVSLLIKLGRINLRLLVY